MSLNVVAGLFAYLTGEADGDAAMEMKAHIKQRVSRIVRDTASGGGAKEVPVALLPRISSILGIGPIHEESITRVPNQHS